ncbi:TPA: hypothetical protein ACVW80_005987 [Bacillus thuringiensis]|uniref:hypothetical protein n=3 Tax=unclassified Bacillus cereus group TaxID=2750818 RepID=UPI003F7A3121
MVKLKITGGIHIKDYEWPGSDEHCRKEINQTIRQDPHPHFINVFNDVLKCGGECRTELNVDLLVVQDGNMFVNVATRFYEGATDSTDELEDAKLTENFNIPPEDTRTITHNLINRDVPGDDTSTVTLTFTNFGL